MTIEEGWKSLHSLPEGFLCFECRVITEKVLRGENPKRFLSVANLTTVWNLPIFGPLLEYQLALGGVQIALLRYRRRRRADAQKVDFNLASQVRS